MASLTAVSCLFFQAAVLQFILVAEASHFRYGTISWAPVDSYSNTLRFTFRLAFRRSFSSSYYCDQSTIGNGSLRGSGGSWRAKCNYCSSTTIASTGFHCTDYSSNEDWTVGENNFNYTFSSYNRWVVSYSGCCWISLSRYRNGNWFISTTVNLTRRSDNGRINSSPVSRSPAIVRWSEGCPSQSLRIPVEDADGDVVKCRYANYSESYFNNDSFPYGTFDEKTCLLTYNGKYGTAGTYAVALTIEDFPAGTTNFDSITPFSAVGLQFLVIISSHSGSCNNVPVFTPSTPNDGECTEVQTGSLYRVVIEATLADYSKSVVEIVTSSPPGMQFTSLRFHGGVYYRNVTWYPNQYQVGQQSFCFKAVDSSGMGTEWRCVTILVGISSTPRVVWGSQTPQSRFSNSGPGYVWWSIQFDRVIKKPRTSSYIRLVLLPGGHTVHKVDTLSQFAIINSDLTTLWFAMPDAALSMNGSYAILMDRGAVVGQGCSYDGPPTPGITNTSDWQFTAGVCPVGYTLAPPDFSNCVDINECGSYSRSKRSFYWWGYTTSSSTQWLTTAISPSTSSSYVPFTASFPGSCSRHIYGYYSYGSLYSPGYPGCYADNLICTWLIEAPSGYYVYLYFYHLNLEYCGSSCFCDYVEIRDGSTLSSPLITKTCGSLGYFYVYSSGRFLLLRFRTDGRVQGAGFAGYYRTLSYRGSNWIPSNQVSSTSFVACVPSQTLVTRISTTLPIIPTTSSSYIPSTISYSEILGLNNSVIVGNNSEYLANLTNWIKPKRSESDWKLCWRASRDGWDGSRFHSLCDEKGPTVTIVKVGKYIFGGYTSLSWGYGCFYQYDPQAFLFSLVNKPGWPPVKLNQTGFYGYYQSYSIYTCYSSGPTFGGGFDLRILPGSNLYYTNLGHTYSPPSGYSYRSSFAQSFLAGSYTFNPDEVETFYDTTFTSLASTRTINPSYTASSIASPSLSSSVSASQSVSPSTSPSVSASLPLSSAASSSLSSSTSVRASQITPSSSSGYYASSSSYTLPAPVDFQFHVPSDCDQICTNTPGSYRCSCVRGYQLSSDEKSCVDIDECSTNNGGCSHHCYNIPGSFYCGCPEGTTMASNNLTCVEPGVSVACDENNMTVSLEKQTFPYFNVSSLHLRYSSCRATENSTHFLISTPLNSCGTLVNETEDALIFWNEIRADAVIIDNVITRTHDIKFKFYCSYSRRKMLSIQFQPQHIFIGSEAGYGNFTFKMDFYKTAAFATPYTDNDYPILVALNEYLYVKYSVESSASNQLAIMAENCKATRYGSFYSWPYYTIIQNGCERDTTMEYTYNPLASSQKLKIRSFRFFNDYDVVYFHCELLACYKGNSNSRCSRGCLSSKRRKRRGAADDEIEHEESTSKHILSSGPIMIKETETETEERDEGDTGKSQQTALIGGAAAAGGLSLIVIIALAVLAVKYRIARRFMNRNKVGDLYTTQDEQMSRRNAYIQEDDMIEREDSF